MTFIYIILQDHVMSLLRTPCTQMRHPIEVLIWVVVKVNDQIVFRPIKIA